MASGFTEDQLGALSLPVLKTDHVLIGRGGETFRVDKRDIVNPGSIIQVTRPLTTDFSTWVNQGVASIADQDYGLLLSIPAKTAADSLAMREKSTPAVARYAVVMGIALNSMWRGNLAGGIALRESSTGKLELISMGKGGNAGTTIERWGSATGGRVTRDSAADHLTNAFLKWCVGGNHYQALMSFDGVNYAPFSEPILMLDFFTTAPNKWGIWGNTNSSPPLDLSVFAWHWQEVTGVDNISPFPAYVNKGGSGNRSTEITVTTDAPLSLGAITQLVDGDYLGSTTKPKFAADSAGNRQITFQFGAAVVINEAKWLQNSSNGQGTWKWQGSNNGSSWTDITTTFTLQGDSTGSTAIGDMTANVTAYSYYRLQQTAGSLTTTPTNRQVHFRIKN